MFCVLSTVYKDKVYKFSPYTGLLFSRKFSQNNLVNKFNNYPDNLKCKITFEIIKNPFLIQKKEIAIRLENKRWIKLYAKLCVWMYRHFYFGLFILSHLRLNVFESSLDATNEFCRIIGEEQQRNLCLPRSIFGATTSKRFKKEGVLFIGVFPPSRQLHAWIIEGNYSGWNHDYLWINYTPISIMI